MLDTPSGNADQIGIIVTHSTKLVSIIVSLICDWYYRVQRFVNIRVFAEILDDRIKGRRVTSVDQPVLTVSVFRILKVGIIIRVHA